MGLDLRKRPHADLTPEAPAPAPAAMAEPPAGDAAGDITLAAVEPTPSFEHATRRSDNPNETRKR
jgi:hypothetical protein